MNQAWSETGDRYILKLFRDFVFHSAGFDGEPIVDIAHIVQCLNKVKIKSNNHFFSLIFNSILLVRCWFT
jgi:hypothetical protein